MSGWAQRAAEEAEEERLWIEGRLKKVRLTLAVQLACDAHAGQLDKGGQPYILHPMRVSLACYPDESAMIVGLLHDVWEDHPEFGEPAWLLPYESLLLLALNRVAMGGSYESYIEIIAMNSTARQVKLADLYDNLRIDRLLKAAANGVDIARLIRKYLQALIILGVKP